MLENIGITGKTPIAMIGKLCKIPHRRRSPWEVRLLESLANTYSTPPPRTSEPQMHPAQKHWFESSPDIADIADIVAGQ